MRKRDVEMLANIIDTMRPRKKEGTDWSRWCEGRAKIIDSVIPSNRTTLFINLCPKERIM